MAKKTNRQHYEEQLASLQDKLDAELAKTRSDDGKVADLKASIDRTKDKLGSNDPKLDQPYGFNWSAV